AEATAAAPINILVGLTVYRDDADQYAELIDRLQSSVAQHFDRIEAALRESPYLVGGAFSAADIMVGFTLWSAKMINLLGDQHPRTSAYLQRLRARPAFSKALDESRRLSLEIDTPSQAQR
ncbi:MAG: glutathione S-transferase C-terminal domain-containing protein, partial [Pseudomonadota bacterium]|nr:glutathione S-transferase C-terminal domain-containing protein [Pseudomonadota bacterium]